MSHVRGGTGVHIPSIVGMRKGHSEKGSLEFRRGHGWPVGGWPSKVGMWGACCRMLGLGRVVDAWGARPTRLLSSVRIRSRGADLRELLLGPGLVGCPLFSCRRGMAHVLGAAYCCCCCGLLRLQVWPRPRPLPWRPPRPPPRPRPSPRSPP